MRKFLTLLALSFALAASAQTGASVSLYGFARPSHPGIVPPNYPNATLMDYRIFVAHAAGAFRITGLRIGGKPYAFRSQVVASPVTVENGNLPQQPRTDTLVPPTKRIVEEVILPRGPVRPGAGALQLRYTWKGKAYVKTLKSWKELEPILHE
ncbi:hypothetical protein [Flaviaesturariibacter terrae]